MAGPSPEIRRTDALTAASSAPWAGGAVSLKFAFAGVLVYKMTFSALELNLPFFRMGTDPCDPPLPAGAWAEGRQAVRIRSHPVDARLRRIVFLPEAIRYVPSQYRRYFVNLEGCFAEYCAALSRHFRMNAQRKVRRMTELSGGRIQWRVYRTPGEMPEFEDLARDVSARSWQEKALGRGFDASAEFRATLLRLAARDEVRGYALFHDGAPAAYACCVASDGVLSVRTTGYDTRLRKHSPGTVLRFLMIEHLFGERRFRRLDFGEGEFPYKAAFATGHVTCADIVYFRRSARNLLLVALHTAADEGAAFIGRQLDRLGLKDRIRTGLHQAL